MKRLELAGQRFERLTVLCINTTEIRKKSETRWDCVCDCGNKIVSTGWHLTCGKVRSCGCIRLQNDRTGHTYGDWTVLNYSGGEKWRCQCKCGTIKDVMTSSFYKNRSKSCGCPRPEPTKEEHEEERRKFILNNIVKRKNGCWDWKRYKSDRGYGTIYFRKKVGQRINRVVWILFNSEIPEGMFVCHKCDRPQCCNPDHLFLGTHEDNMRDMAVKGRACKGKKHHKYIKSRKRKCLKK